jgi:hypothetical protein
MKKLTCFIITVTLGFALVGPASAASRKARDGAPRPGQARYKRQPGGKNYRGGNSYRGGARPGPVINGARLVSPGTLARLGDGPYGFGGGGAAGTKLVAQIRGHKVADVYATDRWGRRLSVRRFAGSQGRIWFSYRDPLRGPTYLYFPSSVMLDGPQGTPSAELDGTGTQPPTEESVPTDEGGLEDSGPPSPDDGTPGGE